MSDLCSTLLGLLERQSAGDGSAPSRIADISAQLSGERVYRDPVLTPQQVRAVELLLSEWGEMFSFKPGRPEGLPRLISLLNEVCRNRRIEPMEIYEREEWKKIVALRGPVETVQVCECATCRRQYPRMGMSGFLDLAALVCGRCGAVVFRSIYEEEREAACPCGDVAKSGCPSCGSLQARVMEEIAHTGTSRIIRSIEKKQADKRLQEMRGRPCFARRQSCAPAEQQVRPEDLLIFCERHPL